LHIIQSPPFKVDSPVILVHPSLQSCFIEHFHHLRNSITTTIIFHFSPALHSRQILVYFLFLYIYIYVYTHTHIYSSYFIIAKYPLTNISPFPLTPNFPNHHSTLSLNTICHMVLTQDCFLLLIHFSL
jgi:hypothetical protein